MIARRIFCISFSNEVEPFKLRLDVDLELTDMALLAFVKGQIMSATNATSIQSLCADQIRGQKNLKLTIAVSTTSSTPPLQIQYKRFCTTDAGSTTTTLKFAQQKIIIFENPNPKTGKSFPDNPNSATSLNLWDGSVLLSRYLTKNSFLFRDKSVLELGAGLGLCSIVCDKICNAFQVLATDLEIAIDGMQQNVANNSCTAVDCQVFDWFQASKFVEKHQNGYGNGNGNGFDFVVAADVVWVEGLVDAFVSAARAVCGLRVDTDTDTDTQTQTHTPTELIIAYQRRGKVSHEKFFAALNENFEDVELIDIEDLIEGEGHELFSIVRCCRLR